LSGKVKTRISVTVTPAYVGGLNELVEKGLYLNRGEIVLEALRILFRSYGLEPFIKTVEEELLKPV